ncbi:MAG: YARHG domain-containing protein [Fimbriimonadaceae bacterium]|nr:YARHG domain-containing protein [Fimbriimonadaceae bacterium]
MRRIVGSHAVCLTLVGLMAAGCFPTAPPTGVPPPKTAAASPGSNGLFGKAAPKTTAEGKNILWGSKKAPEEPVVPDEPAPEPEPTVTTRPKPTSDPADPPTRREPPIRRNPPAAPTGSDLPAVSGSRLSDADLAGLDARTLTMMRNEPFARRGYTFKRADLRAAFSAYDWYSPVTSDLNAIQKTMSANEKYNVDFIRRYQERTGRKW